MTEENLTDAVYGLLNERFQSSVVLAEILKVHPDKARQCCVWLGRKGKAVSEKRVWKMYSYVKPKSGKTETVKLTRLFWKRA